MITFSDLLEHIVVYAGRDNTKATAESCRRAAQMAVQILPTRHSWLWYRRSITITLSPVYSTGTVTYDSATRVLTLSGGTWPSWAVYGSVRIDGIEYLVQTRTSGTELVLQSTSCPDSDIVDATAYQIRRFAYQLPADCSAVGSVILEPYGQKLSYRRQVDPIAQGTWDAWLNCWGLYTDRTTYGRYCLIISPNNGQTGTLQVSYQATIQPLRYDTFDNGFVSVSGTTVTGQNTKFRSDMVGQVFRCSLDGKTDPTSLFGNNPYIHESIIASVAGGEAMTLETAIASPVTRVKAVVSSILDVKHGPMYDYLCREAEKQLRAVLRMAPSGREELTMWMEALTFAREDDSPYTGTTVVDYRNVNYVAISTGTVSQ